MTPARRREAAIDALRALALLPVVVVNVSGYANLPWGGPLIHPDGSVLGLLATGFVAALLQGKGYPLLMFLFGYSLSLAARHAPLAQARRRLSGLLVLGLLHGFLVYMGDILSTYALVGWAVLPLLRARLARVRRWLLGAGLLAVGMNLLMLITLAGGEAPPSASLADQTTLLGWWGANALGYLTALLAGTLAMAPEVLALMLLGVVAERLAWLRHRRWVPMHRCLARWAMPFVWLNLGVGAWAAWALQTRGVAAEVDLMPLSALLGPLTLATWVSACWLRWSEHGVPRWMAEAGRQTLTPYLLSSCGAVLLWTQPALGWHPGTALAVSGAVVLWALLMAGSRWASQSRWRLPAEAWLAAR